MWYVSALSLLPLWGMWFISYLFPPQWAKGDRNWIDWVWGSLLAGLLSHIAVSLFHYHVYSYRSSAVLALALVASSTLAFVGIQSVYTDFKWRKVDRRIMWVAIVSLIPLGAMASFNTPFAPLYWLVVAVSFCMLFFPQVGMSDARAIIMAYPSVIGLTLSLMWFNNLVLMSALGVIAYGLYVGKQNGDGVKALWSAKLSIPFVPFVLIPAWLTVIAHAPISYLTM